MKTLKLTIVIFLLVIGSISATAWPEDPEATYNSLKGRFETLGDNPDWEPRDDLSETERMVIRLEYILASDDLRMGDFTLNTSDLPSSVQVGSGFRKTQSFLEADDKSSACRFKLDAYSTTPVETVRFTCFSQKYDFRYQGVAKFNGKKVLPFRIYGEEITF